MIGEYTLGFSVIITYNTVTENIEGYRTNILFIGRILAVEGSIGTGAHD